MRQNAGRRRTHLQPILRTSQSCQDVVRKKSSSTFRFYSSCRVQFPDEDQPRRSFHRRRYRDRIIPPSAATDSSIPLSAADCIPAGYNAKRAASTVPIARTADAHRRSKATARDRCGPMRRPNKSPHIKTVHWLRRTHAAPHSFATVGVTSSIHPTATRHPPLRYAARHPRDKRLAHAAFPGLALASAELSRTALIPGPLSLENSTSVLAAAPVSRSALITSPTLQSSSCRTSP